MDRVLEEGVVETRKPLSPINKAKKRSEQDSPLRTVVGVLEDASGNCRRRVTCV